MGNETKPYGFQIAIDLGYSANEDLEKYERFLRLIEQIREDMPVMSLGKARLLGNYDQSTHKFYVAKEENAKAFADRLEASCKTGLIKAVHLDEMLPPLGKL